MRTKIMIAVLAGLAFGAIGPPVAAEPTIRIDVDLRIAPATVSHVRARHLSLPGAGGGSVSGTITATARARVALAIRDSKLIATPGKIVTRSDRDGFDGAEGEAVDRAAARLRDQVRRELAAAMSLVSKGLPIDGAELLKILGGKALVMSPTVEFGGARIDLNLRLEPRRRSVGD